MRHHVECKQTFDGAAATAKVDRKDFASAASAKGDLWRRRLETSLAAAGPELASLDGAETGYRPWGNGWLGGWVGGRRGMGVGCLGGLVG